MADGTKKTDEYVIVNAVKYLKGTEPKEEPKSDGAPVIRRRSITKEDYVGVKTKNEKEDKAIQ